MTQADQARLFSQLHISGNPLVLHNIWDAGSATTIAGQGARAVATGSASVAAAQGYGDGENIPLKLLLALIERITASVTVPVSVDFESGYAGDAETLASNINQLVATGAVGINFEDQIIGKQALFSVEEQSDRIAAVRRQADACEVPLFINARTDLFLQQADTAQHAGLLGKAINRAAAYRKAGASGFFVPGLIDSALISRLCDAVDLPVNVMALGTTASTAELADTGVARISYGPGPYRQTMAGLAEQFSVRRRPPTPSCAAV
jgi:2-methylisocitrate lyase-like PEP mutase family enzyme